MNFAPREADIVLTTRNAISVAHKQVVWWITRAKGIVFDRLHDVDTYAAVPDEMLEISGENHNKSGRYAYDPTPWNTLSRVLRLASLPIDGFTFVDFGCGKGRMLLAAMRYPFAHIIGVEFSPYLSRVAQKNLVSARFIRRRCTDARVICIDAVEYPIPENRLIIFFYNPFSYKIMEMALNNIVNSYVASHRHIYLIFYATSVHIPKILEFMQRQTGGNLRQRLFVSLKKRTVYVFELPQNKGILKQQNSRST